MQIDVEPFIDLPDSGVWGGAFGFGYRSTQTGAILMAVTNPSGLVASVIPLEVSAHLTFGGAIVTRAEISNFGQKIPNNGFTEVSPAQLVEQILSRDNLRMDQAGKCELTRLADELEILAQRVRAAISAS